MGIHKLNMLSMLVICLLCSGAWVRSEEQNAEGKIILGHSAEISDFPYNVAMIYRNGLRCGASILSPSWILTAAHCVNGIRNASSLSIRAGSTERNSGGQLITISEIHQHPRYNHRRRNFDFDIALLRLSEDLEMNDNVTAIEIARRDPRIFKKCVATGWGTRNPLGLGTASSLRRIRLPIVPKILCQLRYFFTLTRRQICAGYELGLRGVCYGDSGGPLVCDGKQVGIVSFGVVGCVLPHTPAVFTKLSNNLITDYIRSVTRVGL